MAANETEKEKTLTILLIYYITKENGFL